MTVTAGEKNAAGQLRDAAGRRVMVVKTENDPLATTDVQTSLGVVDADGREHVVIQGVVGAQGPAGAGAIGVDVWNSQANPASVTDWGPIINTLIANGAKRLNFRHVGNAITPTVYPFSTQLDFTDTSGLDFEGESDFTRGTHGTAQAIMTRLMWKGGAGSGPALKFSGTDGFVARNMAFMYDNAAYNGDLIHATAHIGVNNGGALWDCCFLGPEDSAALHSAASILRLPTAVGWKFVNGCVIGGANYAIRGDDANSRINSDDLTISNCMIGAGTTAILCNIGQFWVIKDNVIGLGGLGGGRSQAIIDSDHSSVGQTSRFTFHNNRVWDPADTSHVYFEQRVLNPWLAGFERNWFYNNGCKKWNLNGPGDITITDNYDGRQFQSGQAPIIDLGNPATARKSSVCIRGNDWQTNDLASGFGGIVNIAGHENVYIGHNAAPCTEVLTVRDVHLGYGLGSTYAGLTVTNPHANSGGVGANGNDVGGEIGIGNTTGTIPAGAKIADFAFKQPPGAMGATPSGVVRMPAPILCPIVIGANPGNITDCQDAQMYAVVTAGSQAGFSIYTRNAITAGKALNLSYWIPKI